MADNFHEGDIEDTAENQEGDVAMVEDAAEAGDDAANVAGELPFAGTAESSDGKAAPGTPDTPRISFAEYLTSPIVTLVIGTGDNETVLTAHQALLAKSPYFAELFKSEVEDDSVR